MNPMMFVAVLAAFFVKGVCGFANTLVFTTAMSFTADNASLSPIDLALGYLPNLYMAWKERRHAELRVWLPLALMVLAGSIPGALLLKGGDARVVKLLFGVLVVALALEMLLRERAAKKRASKPVLLIVGVVSGVLCGLYGVGALLAAYVSRTTDSVEAFKGNMCIVFSIENTFRIVLYAATGLFTLQSLKAAALLLPMVALGLWLGMATAKRLPEKRVKRIVVLALLISGAALIASNL